MDSSTNTMDHYCRSTFWDTNVTWNTTNPDFTECFENTALLWTACSFLWICSIFDIYFNADPIRIDSPTWLPGWTRLGVFKIFNIAFLTCLQVTILYFNWSQYTITGRMENIDIASIPNVLWLSPLILIVTNVRASSLLFKIQFLSACLIVFHKTRCIHTSGIQLIYWIMLSLVHGLLFHTKFLRYFDQPDKLPTLVLLGVSLSVMMIQSILFCWSDIPVSEPTGHVRLIECDDGVTRQECPLLRASCLSFILFSWCTPLVRKGNKNPLTKDDLWDLLVSVKAQIVFNLFDNHFGKPNFGEIRGIYRNILKPLWKTCGWSFTIAVVCRLIGCLISFLSPQLLSFMIEFVEIKSIEQWKGYFWATCLLVVQMAVTVLVEQYYLHMFKCYLNIMSCLDLLIYRKSLRISHETRKHKTTGEIVNLMSVDVEKVRGLVYEADSLFTTPAQVTVGIILLWWQLGISVLPGIGLLCSIIPINWILVAVSAKYQRKQMTRKDERIRVISEILSGIQVIKLYAWEPSFQSQIQKIRSEEIRILKLRSIFQCIMQFVSDSIPFLVSVAAFYSYVYINGGELDTKKAFTAVTLFALLTDPITELPSCISAMIDATVSFKRLNDFFNAEEIDPNATKFQLQNGGPSGNLPAIEIIEGNFTWEDFSNASWQLVDIDLKIKTGELTAIVGIVASGKSSLFGAILGEMKYSGKVMVRGKVAYAPQIPWILNGTVRENICFGLPFDKEKYNKVLDACCLNADLEILPAGDMTEIGEKGINLSGGQKQRISLARVAYSNADILMMDDVFSAVDCQVSKRIFDKLLGANGLLAGKTRVLCTHAYNYLSQCDYIVLMEGGRILELGSYTDLKESRGTFSRQLEAYVQPPKGSGDFGDEDEKEATKSIISKPPALVLKDAERKKVGKLTVDEHMETGDVKFSVIKAYLRAMGYPLVGSFVIFFMFSEALMVFRSLVLKKWASATGNTTVNSTSFEKVEIESVLKQKRNTYAVEYTVLGISQSLFYFFGCFILAIASLRATKLLHNNMLKRILRAPMSFFNVTLLGRIVNRFSSDIEILDRLLPSEIGDWICYIFKLAGVLIAISYTNVYFLIFILPMCIIYYFLQRYYISCMQQLQRILNVYKSPIFSQCQETLNGTSTVRAFKAEERFSRLLADKIDSYNRAQFPHLIVRRWLSIRLGALGSLVVFIPALFAVIWRDTTDPGDVGLSLSYALTVTIVLSWLVKVTSYLQYNFVSAERVLEYSEVEQEAEFETGEGDGLTATTSSHIDIMGTRVRRFNPEWPDKGEISFKNYETRYRPGLDLVLKHFTCDIHSGEKIGIVGRTGGGKSTLTLALFRIIESTNGRILIDGVDISHIGLHDLRRRLTVIPQDPVLFSRSVRLNLDPFEEYEDEKLWEALELAHLRDFVKEMPNGLEYHIAEGGENLSVGQRQLICLARACLRKSVNILVLDEATASVDSVTDELIQKTIREHFVGCTILNVAHRLNTVLDSSRILVLNRGEMVEFDTPQALLANPDSHFYGMARDAGIVTPLMK